MREQVRARGRQVAKRFAPGMVESLREAGDLKLGAVNLRRQVNRLRNRVAELEVEVQENRRLNRRVAELTDVVQELLVPIAQHDQKRLQELLDRYAKTL